MQRTLRVALALVSASLALAACERSQQAPPVDTATPAPPPPADTAVTLPPPRPRDVGFGPALVVPSSSTPTAALVVFPGFEEISDTTSFGGAEVSGTRLDVFNRGGQVGRAQLVGVSEDRPPGGCSTWPAANLRPTQGSSLPSWSVALTAGRAQAIPLQSIETLSGTDSARVAAEATRLASALPNDTSMAFKGIPFFVRIAYRFTPVTGVQALVAEVVRKVNVEANPLEEHILLVAERDSADTSGRYRPAYSNRTSGTETSVVSTEVLAAVTLSPSRRPALVLDSVGYEGDVYSLLERTGPARWTVRWRSAYAGC
ncbi:MAG TPA: hypothetical protein VJ596_11920 [Gemmatimonadaceae bacterium]|nr:hypothetical protein [Gemmatimonadaceae bacterium]